MNGKVKELKIPKGYGFVEGDDGMTYFLHASECQPRGIFDLMKVGNVLEFDKKLTQAGLRATNVRCEELRTQLTN